MSKNKTKLTLEEVKTFLREQCANEVGTVQQLIEGEESQAFSCECGKDEYVIRINPSIDGFQKDAYVYRHFHSERLPIPRVIQMGYIDEQHAFCLTEKMPGITLQEVDSSTLKRLLEPTTEIWLALRKADLGQTTGFGDFDAAGQGAYATWQEFLLAILDPQTHEWDRVLPTQEREMCQEVIDPFLSLVKQCPEERTLIHGDFGSNNVLTDGQRITAVLDWENAKYGDPLYDVATAYFWSPWLECMATQATHFEAHLSTISAYHERLTCYQLRIGLAEIYETALQHQWSNTQWAIRRCREVVAPISANVRPKRPSGPTPGYP